MGVSKNIGTPKSSILIGFSIIFTIHFGFFPPIFGNINIYLKSNFIVVPLEKNPESRALCWCGIFRRCSVPSQRTCPPAQGLDYWQESFRDFSTNLQGRGTPFPASRKLPILQEILDWEWYGSMGGWGSHVLGGPWRNGTLESFMMRTACRQGSSSGGVQELASSGRDSKGTGTSKIKKWICSSSEQFMAINIYYLWMVWGR